MLSSALFAIIIVLAREGQRVTLWGGLWRIFSSCTRCRDRHPCPWRWNIHVAERCGTSWDAKKSVILFVLKYAWCQVGLGSHL